jgi:MobA-like NTP transferase domain
MDAIIVAGGIPGPEDPLYPLTQGRPKALLDLEGQPMLQWVVNAVEAAPRVEQVFVVWPGPESSIRLGPRSTFIPDQGGLIANIQAGLQVEASDVDLDYAVVERSVMDRAFPGSHRSFTPLKGIEVCGADLNGVRVSVTSDKALWDSLYATRKNAFKQASLLGFDLFFLAVLRRLTLEDAARRAGQRLGLKAHVTLCPYAEIGMDVDKPHQLEMVRQHLRSRTSA